jgi:hypothetical protein
MMLGQWAFIIALKGREGQDFNFGGGWGEGRSQREFGVERWGKG